MSFRYSSVLLALCVASTPLMLVAPSAAQSTQGRWVMPRTADGHPDLQGNWSNATLTPIQRPRDQSLVVTVDAAAQRAKEEFDYVTRRARPCDPNRTAPPVGGTATTGQGRGQWVVTTISTSTGAISSRSSRARSVAR